MLLLYLWIAVQIIIEMLPISSSTHLRLLEYWFKKKWNWDITFYFKQRTIELPDVYFVLHLPTLIVVLLYFSPYWLGWLYEPGLLAQIGLRVFIADAVTVCIYFLFKKYSISWPLIFGMSITGLALLLTGTCDPINSNFEWSLLGALFLGLVQGIALLPGISRLAFTTAAGCCMGLSLFRAFFVSWLIQIPLMVAAVCKSMINLYFKGTLAQLLNWRTCLVMLVSGVISWYALDLVVWLIITQKWWWLGWYMIIPISLWVFFNKKK